MTKPKRAPTKAQLQMARNRFFSVIHALVGICGHCGKTDCPEKGSYSVLAKVIETDIIISAWDTLCNSARAPVRRKRK